MNKSVLFILLTVIGLVVAPMAQAKVSKEQKELLKTLKKNNGYKDAKFIEADGFTYILIVTKKQKYIIADTLGRVILSHPDEVVGGYDVVKYVAPHAPGKDMYHYRRLKNIFDVEKDDHEAYYCGNPAVFMATSKTPVLRNDFYGLDGTLLNTIYGKCETARQLPLLIVTDNDNKGVANLDGRIIIEPEHYRVDMSPEGVCFPVDRYDGIDYYGGVSVANDGCVSVPCRFAGIRRDGGHWYVSRHSCYPREVYDSNQDYPISYLDDGEKFFEQGKYTKCRDFYELRAYDAPWAQFYIGMSYYKEALQAKRTIEDETKQLVTAKPDTMGKLSKSLNESLDSYESLLRSAVAALEQYAKANEDTHLTVTAKKTADKGFDALSAAPEFRKQVNAKIDEFKKQSKFNQAVQKVVSSKSKKK